VTVWNDIAAGLQGGRFGRLLLLIRYGNLASHRDRDFVAIYDHHPPRGDAIMGGLDLAAYGIEAFRHLIAVLDPLATEPVLTGEHAWGDEMLFCELREQALRTPTSPGAIRHLVTQAMVSHQSAERIVDVPELASLFWTNLQFAISYWLFAAAYQRGITPPLRLPDVPMPDDVRPIWKLTRAEKDNPTSEQRIVALNAWTAYLSSR
jgi:hypothetical protein